MIRTNKVQDRVGVQDKDWEVMINSDDLVYLPAESFLLGKKTKPPILFEGMTKVCEPDLSLEIITY